MNSLVALILGLGVVIVTYYLYARSVDRTIFQTDVSKATPAKMYMDGVDFMPATKNVLFGYQFKSIAALGPVVGPIIAAQWGWLPALIWVIAGACLIGWVQDYSSAMISVRSEGQTFGGLSYRLISPRARMILLLFIYFYLLLIMGAFGSALVGLFVGKDSVAFGMVAVTLTGLLAGQMIYKWKKDIILTTVVTVGLAFVGIYLGTMDPVTGLFAKVDKASPIFMGQTAKHILWAVLIMVFCYFGATLPIWRFAQPINYVSFYIVFIGMIAASLGIVVGRPDFTLPAFTTFEIGIGPLWPILFVTIACGAVSGWHSLVSSSGTARQLEYETDARPVTAGAMLAEGMLAILALICAAATFATIDVYRANLAASPGLVFFSGMGAFFAKLGVPLSFGTAFASVMFVVLAITVMQLVLRFMRVATAELVGDAMPLLKNIHIATFIACLLTVFLVFTGYWQFLWVLFGGANQLMAALALMLVSIYLVSTKRKWAFAFVPMVFMYVTTIAALGFTAKSMIVTKGIGAEEKAVLARTLLPQAQAIEKLVVNKDLAKNLKGVSDKMAELNKALVGNEAAKGLALKAKEISDLAKLGVAQTANVAKKTAELSNQISALDGPMVETFANALAEVRKRLLAEEALGNFPAVSQKAQELTTNAGGLPAVATAASALSKAAETPNTDPLKLMGAAAALTTQVKGFALTKEQIIGNTIIGAIALVLIGAALVLGYDGLRAFLRKKAEMAEAPAAA